MTLSVLIDEPAQPLLANLGAEISVDEETDVETLLHSMPMATLFL